MQRRCLNCFNLFDIVYSDKEESEVCPYCGYCEGTPPKELYHLYPGVGLYNNRYVIGTCIGFGGFGITYKAWDNVLETVVAVKEYYPTGLVQRVPGKPQVIIYTGESKEEYMQGLERFLDEAKNMAKFVDNPNIVHVDAFFEENNTAYLVMEYLPGMTLKSYLKSKGGRIGCEEVIPIADAVITALKEIHAGGIIHRDISPDNIMLCNDGRIKLLDFGAARFSDADQERTRSIILKPGFAPPEQYQAKSKQGPWTDIYALCATVYRAITGVLPDESVNRVIEDTVQSPIQIYSDIPERISNTVMKGMSIYPEIRFSNVDELKKALDGEKKVMEPKKELRVRRMKRTITVGIALLVVVSMSLYVYNMYKNKKADVVMNAADISIWIAVDDQMNEDGAKAMMDSGIEAFTSSQEKVNVNYKFIPEDQYGSELLKAYENGEMPTIFQAQYATKEIMEDAASVDKVYEYMEKSGSDDCYLLENYKNSIEESKKIPLSFEAPVVYVKRSSEVKNIDNLTISDYKQIESMSDDSFYISESAEDILLSSLNSNENSQNIDDKRKKEWKKLGGSEIYKQFLSDDKLLYYFGSTEDYKFVNDSWAGRYKIVKIESDSVYVEPTNELSISGTTSDDESRAASLLISYMLKQGAQEALFLGTSYSDNGVDKLQKIEGLPVNKSALKSYTDTNTELQIIDSYTDNMKIKQQ
ncbi:serine/threonine-protein kinase [Coprococcus sp. RTP31081st1_D2_RTP31081_211007]|uniref:serine/threonine-protein kinase n=1 Tax=unclassified Coprococcus TaxID=2684943 RepID=UPI0032ED75F4